MSTVSLVKSPRVSLVKTAPAPTTGEQDALLLLAASVDQPQRVKRSGHASALQSHTARAWGLGGMVD